MNWDRLLEEVKKKAQEGDQKCAAFIELFEELPMGMKERAMKCAIEINVYCGKHGEITEKKLLEIAEKWGVKSILEDEIFLLQWQKYMVEEDRGDLA